MTSNESIYVIAHLLSRICPGRHFADSSLFLMIASILHVFVVEPELDKGRPVGHDIGVTTGLISYVVPSVSQSAEMR